MATNILDLAIREVRVSIPDSTQLVTRSAFVQAARDFCRRTLAWRERNTVATVAGTPTYVVYTPANGVVVDFFAPKLDTDITLIKVPTAKVDSIDMELLTDQDEPSYAFLTGVQNEIQLAAIPDAAYTFSFQLALMPAEAATTIDDTLWDRYGDTIVSGALFRLLRMPGKSWSDPQMAEYHRNLYEAAIPEAQSKSADGNMVGVARAVKYGGL